MTLFCDKPALLADFRRGDRDALETVYRHYRRSVELHLRLLARRSGARELAQAGVVEDLLQEAFLRAFSAPAREAYDGVREFGPYLKAIARNCFIDTWRKRRHERRLLCAEGCATVEQIQANDELRNLELVALEDYLARLPPELRGVYEKRFEQGLSQDDTCRSLALSRRSLRTLEEHLRRGFRKALVREQLQRERYRLPLCEC